MTLKSVNQQIAPALPVAPAKGNPVLRHLRRFGRDEDGALLIFGLMLFFLMMCMGFVAFDLMKNESVQIQLRQTTDRAALAAASRKQSLDPTTVVNDYFAKAGLAQYLNSVTVTQGLNFRQVSIKASADTHLYMRHALGFDNLMATAASTAEERITNVEIVLVLDISGSMNSNSRITNLKSAATEFIDTVLAGDTENRISISIVPYNGQINLGADLMAKYTTTDRSNVTDVNCLDLPSSVYGTTAMSRTLAMPHTGYVDTFDATSQSGSYIAYNDSSWGAVNPLNVWCPVKPANIVRLPSHNATTLKAQINALEAVGATSINAGVKWGLAMLDPASQPMMTEFISAGKIPSYFAGRPFAYQDPEDMKVIVLMTDGEHFTEERMNAGYRGGVSPTNLSPIYRAADGNFSIDHGTSKAPNRYWVPHLTAWQASAYKSGTVTPVQQTWQQVWSATRVQWVAWQLYARALGSGSTGRTAVFTAQMATFRSQTAPTTMDSQLQQVCTLARDNKVVLFGIAFEASLNGQNQIRDCSFAPSYYFSATGLQIKTVFRQIASQISHLRLTQ